MIKNLIFDFGKVLVDYDYEAFFLKYIPDETKRKAIPSIFNYDLQMVIDREAKPFSAIMDDLISRNKEMENEIRIFEEHYTEVVTEEIAGMKELLTRLKAEGYKLYGLSNWCSKVYITMAQFDIFKLLDGHVISSEEKLVKPDPEIYECLFNRFGLKPEECIFTDDRTDNIEGGRSLGMEGIVFQNAKQYEEELRGILDKQI